MTNTKKIAVTIVEDRILADINQRSAEIIRERIRNLYEYGTADLGIVQHVAAKHADVDAYGFRL